MNRKPHSFLENTVASPDTCTHLTGHDHVASLTAALRSLTAQIDALDCSRRATGAARRRRST